MPKHPSRATLRPWIFACLLLMGACAAGPGPSEEAPPRDPQSLLAEGYTNVTNAGGLEDARQLAGEGQH